MTVLFAIGQYLRKNLLFSGDEVEMMISMVNNFTQSLNLSQSQWSDIADIYQSAKEINLASAFTTQNLFNSYMAFNESDIYSKEAHEKIIESAVQLTNDDITPAENTGYLSKALEYALSLFAPSPETQP